MKEVETVEIEDLNLSERFCWAIERKTDHWYHHMLKSLGNKFQLCDDKAKLDSIECKTKRLRNKLAGSDYHDTIPVDLINTDLKQCLKIYFDSLIMSSALFLEYCPTIEYGKFIFNRDTKTLTVCPLSIYSERPGNFYFSSLDKFKPLIKHIEGIKQILYLNDLATEIKNKQIAEQRAQSIFMSNCNDETETCITFPAKTINKCIPKILAFTYKGNNQSIVLKYLKRIGAISQEVTLEQFNELLNGKEVTNPLKWYMEQGDLKDFLQTAINSGKFTCPPQLHWKIAEKCFIKPDGSPFNAASLKVSQPTVSSYKFIDAANKF